MVNSLDSSTSTVPYLPKAPLLPSQTPCRNWFFTVAKERHSKLTETRTDDGSMLECRPASANVDESISPLYELVYMTKQTNATQLPLQALTIVSGGVDAIFKMVDETGNVFLCRSDGYMIVAAPTDLIGEKAKKQQLSSIIHQLWKSSAPAGMESYGGKLDVDNSKPEKLVGRRFTGMEKYGGKLDADI